MIQTELETETWLETLTLRNNSPFPDPVSDVTDEVEEEVSLRHADHLVRQLDKQAEALSRLHVQSLRYRRAEVGGTCRGFHQESLR